MKYALIPFKRSHWFKRHDKVSSPWPGKCHLGNTVVYVCVCVRAYSANPRHDWFDLTRFGWYARSAIWEDAFVFSAHVWKVRSTLKWDSWPLWSNPNFLGHVPVLGKKNCWVFGSCRYFLSGCHAVKICEWISMSIEGFDPEVLTVLSVL